LPRTAAHEVSTNERALIVCVETDQAAEPYAVEELASLAGTAGADVVGDLHQHRSQPDPAYYIGKGKAEEIAAAVLDTGPTS
jgi:GTPase